MKHPKWIALAVGVGLLFLFSARSENFIDMSNLMEIDELLDDDEGSNRGSIADPLEGLNRTIFGINNFVYKTLLRPFTHQYVLVVPKEARRAVGNFFVNLEYPVRFTGSILQLKIGHATKETGKFLINSTVGIGGLIDVTKEDPTFDLPEEDIGQVFGSWGINHGFYIVLPFLGPSSLRGFAGRLGGNTVDPLSEPWTQVDDTHERLLLQCTDTINDLPEIIDLFYSITNSAIDPYAAVRNGYTQYRANQVKE
ncbi:MAG: VacJ family lipoprotein [Opitutaceae bacterium]|nr:VacJ family lipoprotein [Opitutaceae bacterium]